ncbi:hypothetical protein [Xanthovirga aplysinae]|uniref:hypothetical protein n=1 Tax=Xanthovirga aplysinae TaxID=2529853 RepID=UPI0012BBAF06|nr:hypothetical protein [Xanthovirga aplysinae]MTI32874.1 hypothetical protein [Xanthovirga aplysinae]
MKALRFLTLVIFVWVLPFKQSLIAQNEDRAAFQTYESQKTRKPFQFSFFPPIGTNGMASSQTINQFSFNLICGVSGGVDGFELGGVLNLTNGNTDGFQLAGMGNMVKGITKGVQVAGFYNLSRQSRNAVQLAGFTNINGSSKNGIQIAGFANINSLKNKKGEMEDFLSFFAEQTTGNQLAGFANISAGDTRGLQIAGFSNINSGKMRGVQLSGFVNVNSGDLDGLQIAGFFNHAQTVNGLQLGFINVADRIESGLAIGFLNFIKEGYRRLEVEHNEYFTANVSFKTGTKNFYNILSLGARAEKKETFWGFGYGIGTLFPVSNKVDLSIDAIAYNINEEKWWKTQEINMLNKLKVSFSYQITEGIEIYGGPSINVIVSNRENEEGSLVKGDFILLGSHSWRGVNTLTTLYPGFQAGLRLFGRS